MVRNPYSRLASEYRFVSGRVGGSPQQFDIDRWVNLVFDKYLEDPFVLCNHIRPQLDFVAPGKTRIFKLENGIESMMRDVMGRLVLEQGLRSDDLLTKKVVIPRENLTRKKLSNGISREEEVMRQSSSLSLRIKDFYAEDFKTFYPKDL